MEERKDEEESTLNEGEAEVAMAHAKRLIQSGVQPSEIGIITPYAAQVYKGYFTRIVLELMLTRKLRSNESNMLPTQSSRSNIGLIAGCVTENVKKQRRQTKKH